MEERELLVNAIMCPDGTILESRHTHDFQQHTQEDGRSYFVDGGLDYCRLGYSDKGYLNLCVYTDDEHNIIRQRFEWTSLYDKDMNLLDKPVTKLIKDLDDDHIKALVDYTSQNYPAKIHKVLKDEFEYRKLGG